MIPIDIRRDAVPTDGFARVAGVATRAECRELSHKLGEVEKAGKRGLLPEPVVAALAHSEKFRALVRPFLTGEPVPVRAIFFDKTADKNWLVPWHQDLNIAVAEKHEVPGWGPWSVKDGLPHVRPPAEQLADMLTVRLHLDDCDADNGALLVLPGTHANGILKDESVASAKSSGAPVLCSMPAGDALLMRPLLLHASGKSVSERRDASCTSNTPGSACRKVWRGTRRREKT